MQRLPWLRIGAVAALWTIVAGAAISGWMIGKKEAAREYSELQRRLTAGDSGKATCGIDVELLKMPGSTIAPPPDRARERQGEEPIQISAPGFLNLRELLTAR